MIAIVQRWWDRVQSSPLGRRLTYGLTWSLVGMLASRGATLLGSVVAARILGKERFGELGMIQNTSGMFALFAGFGMGVTATKYVAEFRLNDPARAGRIIALSNVFAWVMGVGMTLALFVMSGFMARHSFHDPTLETALRIGALLPLISAISGVQAGALTGFEAFRGLARLQVVSGLASCGAIILGAQFFGVNGATVALVAGAAFNWLLTHWALGQECRAANLTVNYREWRRELPVVWRFSLPALQASALVVPVNWYCSTVMLAALPGGDAQVGIFNVANQWFTVLLTIPNLVAQALLPVLSEKLSSASPAEGIRLLKTSLKFSTLTAVPMVLLALASPLIMGIYGSGFSPEWPTMVITVLTAGLLAMQTPVGQVIIASGNIWPGLWMNVGWGVLYVAASFWLVRWGAPGIAAARLAAYVIHGCWTFWFAFAIIRHNRLPHTVPTK